MKSNNAYIIENGDYQKLVYVKKTGFADFNDLFWGEWDCLKYGAGADIIGKNYLLCHYHYHYYLKKYPQWFKVC